MDEEMCAMARGNYGYGRWEAPYWFIGPEQGMGQHEKTDLTQRVEAWIELGQQELNDCREFHSRIGEVRWHFKEPKVDLQSTWRPLMLLMMTFLGREADAEALRNYQRDTWGTINGETCVIELSGLAAPTLKEAKDTGAFLQERIQAIRRRMRQHRPELIVMYGKLQRDAWEKIASTTLPDEPNPFVIGDPTILVFTPHPVSRIREGNGYLGNKYWTRLGRTLYEARR